MCQLTLANLHSKRLNSLYTYIQMTENSRDSHKDGSGFFCQDSVFKTPLAASSIINLGIILGERIKTGKPIISHVRLASLEKLYAPKEEDSHPFDQKNLVLAHNGTLFFRDEKMGDDERFKRKIDSEIFSILLDESYVKTGNMVESLKETYSLFYGKFAFMIFSKPENRYYIARGFDATLYSCTVNLPDENKGIVVNTGLSEIKKALFLTKNLSDLSYGIKIEYEEPKILMQDSIFVLDVQKNSLEKVGDLKEIKRPAKVYNYQDGFWDADKKLWVYGEKPKGEKTKGKEIVPKSKTNLVPLEYDKITNFMWEYDLRIEDIDELLYWTIGTPLLYCTSEQIKTFVNSIVPVLETEASRQKNILKAWLAITNKEIKLTQEMIILKYELQFPYFLNKISEMRDIKKLYIGGEDDK